MTEAVDPRWAWEPYRSTEKAPWDVRKVGHLYRRSAFGANWAELESGLKDGPEKTIDRLLKGGPGQEDFDRRTTSWMRTHARANNGPQAREWWLYRMFHGPHPLQEKMALFWHNHFATSNAKVRNAGFMIGQYALLRRHALGNFREMLQEISRDPAMMVWLDTSTSKQGMPNENYARELMELFSLGIGNYTEKDVREAARAFTGWTIQEGQAVFQPSQHDDGVKTVLGQTGKWRAADVVRICLEQQSASYFLAGKLYRYLVSETMPATPALLEPLAEELRKNDYDVGALVARVLRSNLFFSPLVYRTRVKAPVDFALGIVHALEGRLQPAALAEALATLGQNLFYPPSVKGWDGAEAWLNSQTLLFRQNLALALTSTVDGRFGSRSDPANPAFLTRALGQSAEDGIVDFFLRLFLQADVSPETRDRLVRYQQQALKQTIPVYWTEADGSQHRIRALCHLVLALPEFQLS